MDVRYDYQHSECPTPAASMVMMTLIGCPSRIMKSLAFCGVSIERAGPDFLDVGISQSSMSFPRLLVEPREVGGVMQPAISCPDPMVCMDQCNNFAERVRPGGLDMPASCALCGAVCPINILTTMVPRGLNRLK